ncbi:MAG: kelch repeat-containing protein [Bacteroidota bacterium]
MKKILGIILILLITLNAYSQMGEWTWMNGDSTANSLGHYGTQGVFDSLNTPPGLYEACEWTDKQGNFWLFGGVGQNQGSCYSDLWEFNPSINQWAWIKGPGITDQTGIYGTQGIPSPTNNPGARGWGTPTWVDTSGNLWLFGGLGYNANNTYLGTMNDLWKYSISTNEWTWINGVDTFNNLGFYGIILVPSHSNHPPCRSETNASWTDNTNCLWLFGGGYTGRYSDLWKYSISTNQWIWMKGPNTTNQLSIYGTKGGADSANNPSGRWSYAKWKDRNDNLWLFGGAGNAGYNDMWQFNIITNNWTWMSGTNLNSDTVSIGTLCDPDTNNISSFRYENRACWTRDCDNFMTFGGLGQGGMYNDLWNYNVFSNEWTWMKGSIVRNPIGNYGSKTISDPNNIPVGRMGAVGWKDNEGNIWMFGGCNGSFNPIYNDLWKFVPDSSCAHISCSEVGIKELAGINVKINIYPNPNNGNFHINSLSEQGEKISIEIFNSIGQIIYNCNEISESPFFSKEISMRDYPFGIYVVKVNGISHNNSWKVVIMNN